MKLRPPTLIRRLLSIVKWRAQDEDMDQEMAFHLDAITREYVHGGMSEADAAAAARRRFGNVVRHKEAGHDVRTAYLDQFASDVRSGFRQLANARTFALGWRPWAIAGLVLRQGAGWMAAGLLLGAFGIIVVARLVRELVYGVSAFDPLTIGTSVAVLMTCAAAALLVPLFRATRIDAVVALRSE